MAKYCFIKPLCYHYSQLTILEGLSMKTHLRLAFWALQMLWRLKGIWLVDRFQLWRKSINLYLAFLAFTDLERPFNQMKSAMLSALLSAVYDYDTDWTFGNRHGNNFFSLLQHIESEKARTLATGLFNTDIQHKLSDDGLERGSVALRLYWLVIKSAWMQSYTPEQIDQFGRNLQIIDDLLDLEGDRVAGDTNCFLIEDRTQEFVAEAEEFLKSDFFERLKRNSKVYRVLEGKVRKTLQSFGTDPVTFKQLFATGRPHTGLYAFALSLIGFGFYEATPWVVILFTSLAYAGLTMNIMIFNDWVDRENDRKKGKMLASEHSQELMQYWQRLSGVTALILIPIAYWSVPLAIYTTLVWAVGILYSYAQRRYLLNNALVALCAGAPVLSGAVYHGEIRWIAICTSIIFMGLIFINEMYKDVKDRNTDDGYKITMPIKRGSVLTLWQTIKFIHLPAILFVLHPNPWVRWFGIAAISLVTFQQAAAFLHPEWINRPLNTMRLTLTGLLIILLVT